MAKNSGLGKAQVQMLRDCWRFRDDRGCPLDYRDRALARRLEKRGLVTINEVHDAAYLTEEGKRVCQEDLHCK